MKENDKRLKNLENRVTLDKRTPEERAMIVRKSVEARKKKKYENMQLQKCMSALLSNGVVDKDQKKVLKSVGFDEKDFCNNGALLMTVLFKKGLSGDVSAIGKIVEMMDKLDLYHDTGSLQGDVTINLVPTGVLFEMSEKQKQEIEKATEEKWINEDAMLEWGDDVYEG